MKDSENWREKLLARGYRKERDKARELERKLRAYKRLETCGQAWRMAVLSSDGNGIDVKYADALMRALKRLEKAKR